MEQYFYGTLEGTGEDDGGYQMLAKTDGIPREMAYAIEKNIELLFPGGGKSGEKYMAMMPYGDQFIFYHRVYLEAGSGGVRPTIFLHQLVLHAIDLRKILSADSLFLTKLKFCEKIDEMAEIIEFNGVHLAELHQEQMLDISEDTRIQMKKIINYICSETERKVKLFLIYPSNCNGENGYYRVRRYLSWLTEGLDVEKWHYISFITDATRKNDLENLNIIGCSQVEYEGIYEKYTRNAFYFFVDSGELIFEDAYVTKENENRKKEEARQKKAREEEVRLEKARLEEARLEKARLEEVRQEKVRQEKAKLEDERKREKTRKSKKTRKSEKKINMSGGNRGEEKIKKGENKVLRSEKKVAEKEEGFDFSGMNRESDRIQDTNLREEEQGIKKRKRALSLTKFCMVICVILFALSFGMNGYMYYLYHNKEVQTQEAGRTSGERQEEMAAIKLLETKIDGLSKKVEDIMKWIEEQELTKKTEKVPGASTYGQEENSNNMAAEPGVTGAESRTNGQMGVQVPNSQ